MRCRLYITRGNELQKAEIPADNNGPVAVFSKSLTGAEWWEVPVQVTLEGVMPGEARSLLAQYMAAISSSLGTALRSNMDARRGIEPLVTAQQAPDAKKRQAEDVAVSHSRRLHNTAAAQREVGTKLMVALSVQSSRDGEQLERDSVQALRTRILKTVPLALWDRLEILAQESPRLVMPTRVSVLTSSPNGKYTIFPDSSNSVAVPSAQSLRNQNDSFAAWKIAVIAAGGTIALCAVAALVAVLLSRRRKRNGKSHASKVCNGADMPAEFRASGHNALLAPSLGSQTKRGYKPRQDSNISAQSTQSWVMANAAEPGAAFDAPPVATTPPTPKPQQTAAATVAEVLSALAGSALLKHSISSELDRLQSSLEAGLPAGVTDHGFTASADDTVAQTPYSVRVRGKGAHGAPHDLHAFPDGVLLQHERQVLAAAHGSQARDEFTAMSAPAAASEVQAAESYAHWKLLRSDGCLAAHLASHKELKLKWPLLETLRVLGQASMRAEDLHQAGAHLRACISVGLLLADMCMVRATA